MPSMTKAKPYATFPVYECLIPDDLFKSGIGELVVTRRIPDGNIAMSAFVLDVFCLGVKDAMFKLLTVDDYENGIKPRMSATGSRTFEKIHPTCAKKLLDGLVNYSRDLGFSPHPDYQNAREIFGDVDGSACPVKYTYGKDGKPLYMNGPYESQAKVNKILDTLTQKCGVGGFNYIMAIGNDFDDDFDDD